MKKLFLIISSVLLMSLILGCTSLGNPSPDDNTSLAVSSVTPLPNATGVAIKSAIVVISVTFSKAMDTSSAEGAFTMVDSLDNKVRGRFSGSGNTMTFTPDDDLKYDTVYTCTVGTGAKDSTGNALASAYKWSFKTVYSSDTTAPTISSVIPSNSASNVATLPTIVVTFNEAMNTSSAQNAFTISGGVTGSFNWIGNRMIFTSSSALSSNTAYTCTVGTGAQDLAGNHLAAPYSWSFTTGITDTIAPTVFFTVPSDSDKDHRVPNVSTISVTFNEAMNTSSAQNAFLINGVFPTGSFSWSGNTMIFTPEPDLDYNTDYTCTVGTGAQDLAGNSLDPAPYISPAPYTWSFTTTHTPPTVTTIPTNGAIGVDIKSTISVTFSQPMDEESVTGVCVPDVSGILSWSGNTMTFTPYGDGFASDTPYTCTIGTGAKDLEGNDLVPYSLSFHTSP
jgi:hypothetical protein